MSNGLEEKLHKLKGILRSYPSALVSYSGGVDSTLLATLAREILGDRMAAIILVSPLLPPRELDRAERVAASLGLPLKVIEADELSLPGFRNNPPDRCYLCKRYRLTILREKALAGGWEMVMDGSNADDAALHRPGRRAAAEIGALSPLEEAGLSKPEIRALARNLGLPNWDAPSRPCLATRFTYGMELERYLIQRVDAAEEELEGMGVRQVRVRMEAPDEARIEVGADELGTVTGKDNRTRLVKKLKALGFRRITLDLEGYRSGSMDGAGGAGRYRTLYTAERYGS